MDDWGGPVEFHQPHFDDAPSADDGADDSRDRLSEILKSEFVPRLVERLGSRDGRARGRPPILREGFRQGRAYPGHPRREAVGVGELADFQPSSIARRCVDARDKPGRDGGRGALRPNPAALARCAASGCWERARRIITRRLASGATFHSVMVDDIAPASRRLDQLWRDDDCDFADVTVGAGMLRSLLCDAARDTRPLQRNGLSILLATPPGETHLLGADMAEAVFLQAGWRTRRCESKDARTALACESFDVVGFSLSCDRFADGLGGAIGEARRVSRNRRIKVVVGGALLVEKPQCVARLGADACATAAALAPDFPSTIVQMLRL